jgi:hypothetical protein
MPIKVKDAEEVFSIEFTLDYNAEKMTLASVEADGGASGFNLAYNDLGGSVDVAMAGSLPLSGSFSVAMVTFRKNGLRVPVANAEVSLSQALFNEGDPPAVIDEHAYDGEIIRFELGPVTPNPFTEGTVITYNASQAAGVSLMIFSVEGKVVRRLFDGEVTAGLHQVSWDGRDDCRMSAAGFSTTEKLVLLQ